MIKKWVVGSIVPILAFILVLNGFFQKAVEFVVWLFVLDLTAPEISIAGQIIVRILVLPVSFGLVGVVFSLFRLFGSKFMSALYTLISLGVSVALTYLIWFIESYILFVAIGLGAILLGIIVFFIIKWVKEAKGNQAKTNRDNKETVESK